MAMAYKGWVGWLRRWVGWRASVTMVYQGLGWLAEVMGGLVAQLWPVSKGQNGGGTEKDCLDSKGTCTRPVCSGRGRLGHSHT